MSRKPYPGERPKDWVAPDGTPAKAGGALKTVLLILGGLFALLVLLVAIGMALEDPKDRAAREARMKAEAQASEQAAAAEEKDKAAKAAAGRKAAALAWHRQILANAKPCDDASTELGKQFTAVGNGGSIYIAYDSAQRASEACDDAWSAMQKLEVPDGFEGEARTKAEEANKICANGYFAKNHFADLAKEVLDGDRRPSKVSEATEYAKMSGAAALVCVATAMDAMMKAGVDVKDLPGA